MTDEQNPAPTKGVPLEIGDETWRLRYPLGSLKKMSEGDVDLVAMLHLGLKHQDGDLTIEQVGEMIDLEDLPRLAEPMRKATGGLVDIDALFGLNGAGPAGKAQEPAADG